MQQDPWAAFPLAGQPGAPAAQPGTLQPIISPPPSPPPPPNPGTGFRFNPDGSASPIPGGAGDPTRPGGERDPNRDPGVDQARMAGFLRRAARANNLYMRQNVGAPSLTRETARDWFPNISNMTSSDEQQSAEASAREFIAATLRYESGAAIPPEELEAQRRRYFPMPGDSPETIALKTELRRTALEGLAVSAGPGARDAMAQGETEDIRAAIERARPAAAPVANPVGSGGEGGEIEIMLGEEPPPPEPPPGQRFVGWRAGPSAEFIPVFEPIRDDRDTFDRVVSTVLTAPVAAASIPIALGNEMITAGARGFENTATLGFNDELRGLARSAITGGSVDSSIAHERGIDRRDERDNFGSRLTGQIAGGFALPGSGARSLSSMMGVGAGVGGVYGLGSGEGGLMERLPGAVAGAGIGAGLGLGTNLAGRGVRAYQGRGAADPGRMALAEGMERQGIEGVVPDLYPTQRGVYSFLESLPISGGRVRADVQRGADQLEARLGTFAADAPPRQRAGEIIQAAGARFNERSRDLTDRLYRRAESLAGDVRIRPQQALQNVDQHIAQLSETSSANSGKLSILNQLRTDLVDEAGNVRDLSIQGLRDLRTAMRDELSARGMRYSDTERRVMQVIDAAGTDIEAGLSGNALAAYQRADRTYRQRIDRIDNIVERFMGANRDGQRSGEQAMTALEGMAAPRSGDAERLAVAMRGMNRTDRQQVGASIISQMGRRGLEEGADFSPARFFTDLQRFSRESREAIWGRQGARDLDDLARFAEARGGTIARMNNPGSGRVSNWFSAVGSLLGGSGAGAGLGAATGVGAGVGAGAVPMLLAGGYGMARILGNRDAARVLVDATRATSPAQQRSVIRRLGEVAGSNPALAQDVLGLQRILMNAANDNLPRLGAAAASPDEGPNQPNQ